MLNSVTTLFPFYIIDMPKSVTDCEVDFYAIDTSLLSSGKNSEKALRKLLSIPMAILKQARPEGRQM